MIPVMMDDEGLTHAIQSLDLKTRTVTTFCSLELKSEGMDIDFSHGELEDVVDCEDCYEALTNTRHNPKKKK